MRMWCTPPRISLPPLVIAPGRRFTVPVDGRTVAAEEWGEGPTVYLLHGFGGSRTDFHPFVPALTAAGYRVVAFDAPAHGASDPGALGGRQSVLSEFVDALAAVVRVSGPALALIAHSGGGSSAARAALDGLPVQRLVLIAPMNNLTDHTSRFRAALGYGPRIETGFLNRLQKQVKAPLTDWDIAARAGERQDLPSLLVVHDQDDRRVPPADSRAIADAWPRSQLQLTSGLGHRRILRDPAVLEAVVTFVGSDDTTDAASSDPESRIP
jgi:pimeloyl-ACP methyl ester carboxylesterase